LNRFTRHGESEYNAQGKIGGDSPLTIAGEEYAHALADWVEGNLNDESKSTDFTHYMTIT
jgi:broad specificity phosphatase PhoE